LVLALVSGEVSSFKAGLKPDLIVTLLFVSLKNLGLSKR